LFGHAYGLKNQTKAYQNKNLINFVKVINYGCYRKHGPLGPTRFHGKCTPKIFLKTFASPAGLMCPCHFYAYGKITMLSTYSGKDEVCNRLADLFWKPEVILKRS